MQDVRTGWVVGCLVLGGCGGADGDATHARPVVTEAQIASANGVTSAVSEAPSSASAVSTVAAPAASATAAPLLDPSIAPRKFYPTGPAWKPGDPGMWRPLEASNGWVFASDTKTANTATGTQTDHVAYLNGRVAWLDLRKPEGRALLADEGWPLSVEASGAVLSDDGIIARLKTFASERPMRIRITLYPATATDTFGRIGEITDLHTVYLGGNFVAGETSKLTTLQKLRRLDFSGTPLKDDDLKPIGKLSQLEDLGIINTKTVGDAGVAHLAGLPLRQLTLIGTSVTGKGVEKLPELRQLILHGTLVDDAGLAGVANLSHLEEITLDDTKVTDAGLVHLRGLKKLKYVRVSRPGVTKAAADDLKRRFPKAEIVYR